jgi:hypothetical protein
MSIATAEPPPASVATPYLNTALAAVQAEWPTVAKTRKAEIEGRDGKKGYDYGYADLADCSEAVLPLLGKHGLAFTAWPTMVGGKFVLLYKLKHSSGESETGTWPLPSDSTPQKIGGLLTYYRRYALCAVTGIAPKGDDDDAASANERQRFDGYGSAGAAFDAATPSRPRSGQQRGQAQRPAARPAVQIAPLAEDDEWRDTIAGIMSREDGERVYADVADLHRDGKIDEARAKLLGAHIAARVANVSAAAASPAGAAPQPQAPAAEPDADSQGQGAAPPPIRQEDKGAPKPGQNGSAAAAEDPEWVSGFLSRVASCGTEDALRVIGRELGPAVRDRRIAAETVNELTQVVADRRKTLAGSR